MGPKLLLWLLTFTSSARCKMPKSTGREICTQRLCRNKLNLNKSGDHAVNIVTAEGITLGLETPRSNGSLQHTELNPHKKASEAASLVRLLAVVVQQELSDCNLVLAYDAGDLYSVVVRDLLLLLPNPRQVVLVRSENDLAGIMWVSSACSGYLLLINQPQPLVTFANTHHHTWDYHGRYLVVCQSVEQLEAVARTRNGKKTEHILGAVKGNNEGEWRVYMNKLYWGEGLRSVTTWRHHRFTSHLNLDLFPDKLADLQGATLKVSTFELPPSIMYYRAHNGSLLFRYGEDIALTQLLVRLLNFTAMFAEPADGERWGWQVNSTQWMGMLGELQRDEADIGLANLYITISRIEALDYSAPFSDEGSCFMARVEPPLPRWQALAFPFHPWTWLALLVGLVLYGPVLYVLAAASSRSGDEIKSLGWFGFCVCYTVGLHFREPQVRLPHMDSTRIFVLFLWLYTMILTIAYSTNLTAFLLVRKPPAEIQTIDDIYKSGLEVAGIGARLKDSRENFADIYKGYKTKEEAFARVMAGKAVFWINRGFLNFHIATHFTVRGVPRARIMRECFMPFNIAMGLQRHSPLKRKVDEVIGWVQQSGILKQAVAEALRLAATTEEYGGDGDDNEVGHEGTVVALSLDHMQGVFMLVGIGWVAAIDVVLLETFMPWN